MQMKLPAKVKIKENSLPASIAAWKLNTRAVALVLGNTIHLHHVSKEDFLKDKRWVAHELKHIEQFQRHGHFIFLCKYFVEWIRHGYYNNRFEIEAREAEELPADYAEN
jgi:Domain of unknown function (DUF4157)